MIGVTQPPLVIGSHELAVFLLANVVIFYFCFGKLWVDIKRVWRRQ
jgi:hypothetical protein